MFGPEAPYERGGDVNDVVFPCGQTIGADGDTINLYYGAADSSVALATGKHPLSSLMARRKFQRGKRNRRVMPAICSASLQPGSPARDFRSLGWETGTSLSATLTLKGNSP